MKCFYSPADDAIGTCKNCGRGLSASFAVEFADGLACRGKCEEKVVALIELLNRSAKNSLFYREVAKRNANAILGTSIFLILSGALFLWYGNINGFPAFLLGIGVLYLAYGAYTFMRWRRMRRMVDSNNV